MWVISLIVITLLVIEYSRYLNDWAIEKAVAESDKSYSEGWNDAQRLQILIEEDAEHQKVILYLKESIIAQIENDGRYRRGDKMVIRACDNLFDLENEVSKILNRGE